MTTITENFAGLLERFVPDGDQAFATCRLLPGQWEQDNRQEWAERGTIDGRPATVYWMFDNAEAEVEDGCDIPFDAEHIDRIVMADDDEDFAE